MISFNDLSYRYGTNNLALESITADIPEGIYLLLGENGAGKTTLLHLVAGLLKAIPERACTLDGAPTALREPSVLSRTFFYSDEIPFPYRTIRQMVKHHAVFYPSFDAEMLEQNLADFEMTGNEPIDQFSLGNREKAQLAYVLALHTDVLLLDEPANGLDIESKMALLRMIAGKCDDEHTVLVATHTISDMETLYDGLVVMQANHIRLTAMTEEIAERFAFVRTLSKVDDSLYSEWRGGKMCSILPVDMADELGLESGPVDFAVLYGALHSPAAPEVIRYMTAPGRSDYKPFSNGVDYE